MKNTMLTVSLLSIFLVIQFSDEKSAETQPNGKNII